MIAAEVIHPIPIGALACSCGIEYEVVEIADGLELVCPAGCATFPPPNVRAAAQSRCRRCGALIEPTGKRGHPAVVCVACRGLT